MVHVCNFIYRRILLTEEQVKYDASNEISTHLFRQTETDITENDVAYSVFGIRSTLHRFTTNVEAVIFCSKVSKFRDAYPRTDFISPNLTTYQRSGLSNVNNL